MTSLIHPLGTETADPIHSDEREAPCFSPETGWVNVGTTERVISIGVGALLAAAGLSRRSIPGLMAAAVGGGLIYRGVSGRCNVYQLLDIDRSDEAARPEDFFQHGIHVDVSTTIDRSPWELYQFWRNFENLPKIMSHLECVRVIDPNRSRWAAKAPSIAGGTVEWDAEIINDQPNALIAWRSVEGADVDNAGSVRFVPSERGTAVKVVIDYIPPAGRLGSWVASLFGEEPEQQIREDLGRFKALMETGAIPATEDQPRGTSTVGGARESA